MGACWGTGVRPQWDTPARSRYLHAHDPPCARDAAPSTHHGVRDGCWFHRSATSGQLALLVTAFVLAAAFEVVHSTGTARTGTSLLFKGVSLAGAVPGAWESPAIR